MQLALYANKNIGKPLHLDSDKLFHISIDVWHCMQTKTVESHCILTVTNCSMSAQMSGTVCKQKQWKATASWQWQTVPCQHRCLALYANKNIGKPLHLDSDKLFHVSTDVWHCMQTKTLESHCILTMTNCSMSAQMSGTVCKQKHWKATASWQWQTVPCQHRCLALYANKNIGKPQHLDSDKLFHVSTDVWHCMQTKTLESHSILTVTNCSMSAQMSGTVCKQKHWKATASWQWQTVPYQHRCLALYANKNIGKPLHLDNDKLFHVSTGVWHCMQTKTLESHSILTVTNYSMSAQMSGTVCKQKHWKATASWQWQTVPCQHRCLALYANKNIGKPQHLDNDKLFHVSTDVWHCMQTKTLESHSILTMTNYSMSAQMSGTVCKQKHWKATASWQWQTIPCQHRCLALYANKNIGKPQHLDSDKLFHVSTGVSSYRPVMDLREKKWSEVGIIPWGGLFCSILLVKKLCKIEITSKNVRKTETSVRKGMKIRIPLRKTLNGCHQSIPWKNFN